jgi:hypothetical protein
MIQKLSINSSFNVKYFDAPLPAVVSIFDDREACITMSAEANLSEASALWSSNPCFIALAQSFFDSKWNDARLMPRA